MYMKKCRDVLCKFIIITNYLDCKLQVILLSNFHVHLLNSLEIWLRILAFNESLLACLLFFFVTGSQNVVLKKMAFEV